MQPRKRKAAEAVETDTSKSVLGGMKGGYRVTGEETEDGVLSSEIPFQGKSIICQRRGSTDDDLALIFTHGAGGGIDNPATKLFAEGFASTAPVLCFQGTMNLQSRTASFGAVIDHEEWGVALGGRSMGARAAVIASQTREDSKFLVLVSYPMTSPKGEVRDKILLDLPSNKKVLFMIGDQDKMCTLDALAKVQKKMKAPSWLIVVKGADHGMSLKAKAGVEPTRRKTGELAAQWLQDPTEFQKESFVEWDAEKGEANTDGRHVKQSKINFEKTAKEKAKPSKKRKT